MCPVATEKLHVADTVSQLECIDATYENLTVRLVPVLLPTIVLQPSYLPQQVSAMSDAYHNEQTHV